MEEKNFKAEELLKEIVVDSDSPLAKMWDEPIGDGNTLGHMLTSAFNASLNITYERIISINGKKYPLIKDDKINIKTLKRLFNKRVVMAFKPKDVEPIDFVARGEIIARLIPEYCNEDSFAFVDVTPGQDEELINSVIHVLVSDVIDTDVFVIRNES